ncbi:MAG TPA: heme o synthase [Candidatus Limnocylindrales bacterium]
MTRFQKLTLATLVTTFALVTMGVIVRAYDAGMGCPDWPLCHGQLVPSPGDYKAWLEWIHRGIAAVLGFMVLGVAVLAFVDHRDRRSLLWPSLLAIVLVGFQAWLGRETVRLNNSGESVTAHLASAMADLGLLVYILVRSGYPARFGGRGASQRFTLLAAFAAASTFALLLFGSNVTAGGVEAALVFPDWPLMGGSAFPPLTALTTTHVLHRWVAVVVGLIVVGTAVVAYRTQQNDTVRRLALVAGVLFPIQALIGGLQVLTQLAPWALTLHLALGAIIWAATLGMAVVSYYDARTRPFAGGGGGRHVEARDTATTPTPATVKDTIRAYVALTKPRIIELLLVTTVPAMVLATRQVPGIRLVDWTWLAVWTLVGGTLAAGSANAINCYIDRDIDELMSRTRRRPLPAHEVPPENAVVFGIGLGVISFVVLAYFVNLLAAFLALLAIAFYVVVYTLVLKRSTPQNIVIGGAAGALPPVIGWAAVTGSVGIPALILFALVFYWTPPHFWALSLRIRRDYAAAGVPMLPVVKGIPETSRQILLYAILMVAISFILWAVARMGAIYFVAAAVLGAVFLYRAWILWRQGESPEQSTAEAIRLYKYSISYLTLLFVAVAVDALVLIPIG